MKNSTEQLSDLGFTVSVLERNRMNQGIFINSGILFGIAKQAYERSKSEVADSRSHGSNEPLIAIVFSAAAGEAFINEIGELGSHADLASEPAEVRNVATLIQEVENAKGRTTLKFHVAKLAITGKIFEKGSQPFDEFSLLMKLRNSLLHLEFE